MPPLSTPERIKRSHPLARAFSLDAVHQLGRDTGQATRLRIVTPHRFACKTFYDRLAGLGCATFMRGMLARLIDQ